MTDIDVGGYHADPKRVEELEQELYRDHAPITLPPEYAEWVQDNLLRFTIRLARYKFVARLLADSDRVLEVGSGSGLGAIFLAQHSAHVTGLEVREHEVAEAKSMNRRKNVSFLREDFFEYESPRPPDVIVALDVVEHMPEARAHELVARMARTMDPHGMVIIGTPSFYSYPYQCEMSQASHFKCYQQDELRDLLGQHFGRILPFSMNDEMVHTGHPKMAWYYYMICTGPSIDG